MLLNIKFFLFLRAEFSIQIKQRRFSFKGYWFWFVRFHKTRWGKLFMLIIWLICFILIPLWIWHVLAIFIWDLMFNLFENELQERDFKILLEVLTTLHQKCWNGSRALNQMYGVLVWLHTYCFVGDDHFGIFKEARLIIMTFWVSCFFMLAFLSIILRSWLVYMFPLKN
jgi:hypothetical protein